MKGAGRMLRRSGLAAALLTLLAVTTAASPAGAVAVGWSIESRSNPSPTTWAVQYLLRSDGFELTVDGAFGPETEGRVLRFQEKWGLAADGVVGPNTWTALVRDADRRQDGVRAIQSRLNANGYGVCIDGAFGPLTAKAVSDFQRSTGLVADGNMTQETWQNLVRRLSENEYSAAPRPC